jgi:hypothetical protein
MKLTFNINTLFTSIAILIVFTDYLIDLKNNINIIILFCLGVFQVIVSIIMTIYSILKNQKSILLYIIYWLIVIFYLKIFIEDFFYFSIVIAIYNLYVHYCSFSKSKYNITKL